MAKLLLFTLAFLAQLASAQQCKTVGKTTAEVPDRAVQILKENEITHKYLNSDLTVSIDPKRIQPYAQFIENGELCSHVIFISSHGVTCKYCRETEGHDLYKYNALPELKIERPPNYSSVELRVKAEVLRTDYTAGNFDEPYDHTMTIWADAGVTNNFKIHLRCVKYANSIVNWWYARAGYSKDEQYSIWVKRQLADLAGFTTIKVCESAPAPQAQRPVESTIR